jgi:hypothetical protein
MEQSPSLEVGNRWAGQAFPATGPYPKPAEFSPHLLNQLLALLSTLFRSYFVLNFVRIYYLSHACYFPSLYPPLGFDHPNNQGLRLFTGYRGSSAGIKRPGREADHSPQTDIEVKNSGAVPPLPYVFMAWYLIK